MRYMIWNNKGGVGKTFLTYTLATEYAIEHPEKSVAVVDMCPQANVSEMLLGGDGNGESQLYKLALAGTTISGYIKERYAKSQTNRLGTELNYFVNVSKQNPSMPENLYLLPGDIDLDVCSQLISHMGSGPMKSSWKTSRMLLDDAVGAFENAHSDCTVFIDCNPSFAVYTEIVAVAAREIIIPCTADNASIRGLLNVLRLVHGENAHSLVGSIQNIEDSFFTFSEKVRSYGIMPPRILMVILNKSRSLDAKATKAWVAHSDKIREVMKRLRTAFKDAFTDTLPNEKFVYDIKDGNTLATIANNNGLPISRMKHGEYMVYGTNTMANGDQIVAILDQIKRIVSVLR